jgi:hypothetical protein
VALVEIFSSIECCVRSAEAASRQREAVISGFADV